MRLDKYEEIEGLSDNSFMTESDAFDEIEVMEASSSSMSDTPFSRKRKEPDEHIDTGLDKDGRRRLITVTKEPITVESLD